MQNILLIAFSFFLISSLIFTSVTNPVAAQFVGNVTGLETDELAESTDTFTAQAGTMIITEEGLANTTDGMYRISLSLSARYSLQEPSDTGSDTQIIMNETTGSLVIERVALGNASATFLNSTGDNATLVFNLSNTQLGLSDDLGKMDITSDLLPDGFQQDGLSSGVLSASLAFDEPLDLSANNKTHEATGITENNTLTVTVGDSTIYEASSETVTGSVLTLIDVLAVIKEEFRSPENATEIVEELQAENSTLADQVQRATFEALNITTVPTINELRNMTEQELEELPADPDEPVVEDVVLPLLESVPDEQIQDLTEQERQLFDIISNLTDDAVSSEQQIQLQLFLQELASKVNEEATGEDLTSGARFLLPPAGTENSAFYNVALSSQVSSDSSVKPVFIHETIISILGPALVSGSLDISVILGGIANILLPGSGALVSLIPDDWIIGAAEWIWCLFFCEDAADTVAPTLYLPSDIVVFATGDFGATLAYAVSANDNIDGQIIPTCEPASGSTFPLGQTEVTCIASDSSGNVAVGSFSVFVQEEASRRITVETDKQSYAIGETITITGEIEKRGIWILLLEEYIVTIQVLNPESSVIRVDQVRADDNTPYRLEFRLGGDLVVPGEYTVMVSSREMSAENTFTVVSPQPEPVGEFIVGEPRVVDRLGREIGDTETAAAGDAIALDFGQQAVIETDITNRLGEAQEFAYILQISDDSGSTVFISWISGSLDDDQSFSPAIGWLPDEAGGYAADIFVWDDLIDNPTPLSEKKELSLVVISE